MEGNEDEDAEMCFMDDQGSASAGNGGDGDVDMDIDNDVVMRLRT